MNCQYCKKEFPLTEEQLAQITIEFLLLGPDHRYALWQAIQSRVKVKAVLE